MEKVAVYLTPSEIEQFKEFRKHQKAIEAERVRHQYWIELQKFAESMQNGVVTLTIKDGLPYRIDNPMQKIVFGVIHSS